MAPRATPDPSLEITIPRKIPLFILATLLVQICGGIWFFSDFYHSQKEAQNKFTESVTQLTTQINDLKSTIYTRNEALIQFSRLDQENHRQDQEIQEMRQKLYGGK